LEIDELKEIALQHFSEVDFLPQPGILSFYFQSIYAYSDFKKIRADFEKAGYYPFLRKEKEKKVCYLAPKKADVPEKKYLPLVLLFITLITTTWAGYFHARGLAEAGYLLSVWPGAFSFSLGLIFILGTHEMGHKIASIKEGVKASGPFFIPVPFALGTLGAVIKLRSPLPDKNSAVHLGAAGPLSGIVASIMVIALGLKMSFPVLTPAFEESGPLIYFGEPLLFRFLEKLILDVPPEGDLLLHPLAFAGWIGLLVTFLNLIPLGQLDGGHILRTVLGTKNHRRVSFFIAGFLVLAGVTLWPGWLVWGIIGFWLSLAPNPGAMNELEPLGSKEKMIALLTLGVFIVTAMPVPILIK